MARSSPSTVAGMEAALKREGKTVKALILPEAKHDLTLGSTRQQVMEEIGAWLELHHPVKTPQSAAAQTAQPRPSP